MKMPYPLFLFTSFVLAAFIVTAVYLEIRQRDELRKKAPFPDHLEIKVVTDRWTGVQYYLDGRGGLTKRAEHP